MMASHAEIIILACLVVFLNQYLAFKILRIPFPTALVDKTIPFKRGRVIETAVQMTSPSIDESGYSKEFEDGDEKLTDEMAKELFVDLSNSKGFVTFEEFSNWDDVKDVLNEGIIDEETIQVIFGEVGATSRVLSFDQFKEAVDLLNQVLIALDDSIDDEEFLNVDESDVDNDGDAYQWIASAMPKMKT